MDRRTCPHCGSSMKGWLLSDHVAAVHNLVVLEPVHTKLPERFYAYTCNMCGDGFDEVKQLVKHKEDKHLPKQPAIEVFKCDRCARQFLDIVKYAEHIDVHDEEDQKTILKIDEKVHELNAVQRTIQDNYKDFMSKKLSNNKQ